MIHQSQELQTTEEFHITQNFETHYGHKWNTTSAAELLCFDGMLVHDRILRRGTSDGALYLCCDPDDYNYSKLIAKSMTLTRFYKLKRNLKLCNNDTVPKRNDAGYNPAYKYNLIYKRLVHNTNVISKKADENQVVDETTWGHSGYGESGTGITGHLQNKKVSKGGQTVLLT